MGKRNKKKTCSRQKVEYAAIKKKKDLRRKRRYALIMCLVTLALVFFIGVSVYRAINGQEHAHILLFVGLAWIPTLVFGLNTTGRWGWQVRGQPKAS